MKNLIHKIPLLLVFWILVMLFYLPTYGAGFVSDFIGWQITYDSGEFKDVFHCFGYHALHQVLYFLFFLIYKTFGISPLPWFLIFTFLHGLNGWLLFKVFGKIFNKNQIQNAHTVALLGSVLFLLSPYAAEVVVWKVCLHYLMVTSFILSSGYYLLSYLETGSNKYLGLIFLFYLLALFTIELGLLTPIILIIFYFMWNGKAENSFWLKVVVPQIVLILLYLGINYVSFGAVVGKGETDSRLTFELSNICTNAFKYFSKHLTLTRYLPHDYKTYIFDHIAKPGTWSLLTGICSVLFVISILFFKKLSNKLRLTGLTFLLFFVSLAPILNHYFVALLYGENDRYSYLASGFFFIFLVLVLHTMATRLKRIGSFLAGILFLTYFISSIYFLNKTTGYWSENVRTYNGLVNDFRWYDKEEVYILGIPDNYRGLYMFRIYDNASGLTESLQVQRKKPYEGKMQDIVQYNMEMPTDGFKIKVESSDSLKVEFNQWGNWWWKGGIGASSYEDDRHQVKLNGHWYTLKIKKPNPNAVYIYQQGAKWEEVNFSANK